MSVTFGSHFQLRFERPLPEERHQRAGTDRRISAAGLLGNGAGDTLILQQPGGGLKVAPRAMRTTFADDAGNPLALPFHEAGYNQSIVEPLLATAFANANGIDVVCADRFDNQVIPALKAFAKTSPFPIARIENTGLVKNQRGLQDAVAIARQSYELESGAESFLPPADD